MDRKKESIIYVVTVEASCPAGACRSAGRAENKLMSQAQLNYSGQSRVKNVSCFLKVHGGCLVLGYSAGVMSICAPSPHLSEPELLSGSPVDEERLSDFCFDFS